MHNTEVIRGHFGLGAYREDMRLEAGSDGREAVRANVTPMPVWQERVFSRDQHYRLGQRLHRGTPATSRPRGGGRQCSESSMLSNDQLIFRFAAKDESVCRHHV